MIEKTVKTKKSSGCGKCLLVLLVIVIGFSVLGFVFRKQAVHQFNKLRSSLGEDQNHGYEYPPMHTYPIPPKPNDFGEDSAEATSRRYDSSEEDSTDLEFLSSTDRAGMTNVSPGKTAGSDESDSDQDSSEEDGNKLPVSTFGTTRNSTVTPGHDRSEELNSTIATEPISTSSQAAITTDGSGSGAGKMKSTLSDDEDYVEGST